MVSASAIIYNAYILLQFFQIDLPKKNLLLIYSLIEQSTDTNKAWTGSHESFARTGKQLLLHSCIWIWLYKLNFVSPLLESRVNFGFYCTIAQYRHGFPKNKKKIEFKMNKLKKINKDKISYFLPNDEWKRGSAARWETTKWTHCCPIANLAPSSA